MPPGVMQQHVVDVATASQIPGNAVFANLPPPDVKLFPEHFTDRAAMQQESSATWYHILDELAGPEDATAHDIVPSFTGTLEELDEGTEDCLGHVVKLGSSFASVPAATFDMAADDSSDETLKEPTGFVGAALVGKQVRMDFSMSDMIVDHTPVSKTTLNLVRWDIFALLGPGTPATFVLSYT